ncbi:hypothetical protein [Kitasatospora griseola]|uniref:hypothetical protein n=1 Tax=Kitasatospora griseola TaxID=2064 RepID=UPI0037F83C46
MADDGRDRGVVGEGALFDCSALFDGVGAHAGVLGGLFGGAEHAVRGPWPGRPGAAALLAPDAANTKVWIYCRLPGPAVSGDYGSTTVWDGVGCYQRPGGPVEYFGTPNHAVATDAWIYTGNNNAIGPHCA